MFKRKKSRLTPTSKQEQPSNMKHAFRLFIQLLLNWKGKITLVFIVALLGSITYTVIPWIMGLAIDAVANLISTQSLSIENIEAVIMQPLIWLIIASAFSFLFSFIQERIMASVSEDAGTFLRKVITDKMTTLHLRFYDDVKVGEILSRVSVDIERVAEILVVGFNQFISSFFNIVIGLIVMTQIASSLTLLIFALIIFSGLVTYIISIKSQRSFLENFSSLADFNSLVEEYFTGNVILKSYNKQDHAMDAVITSNETHEKAHLKAMFLNYAIYPAVRFLNQLAFIASAVIGGYFAIRGSLSVGILQAYLQYVSQVSEPITEASFIINSFQAALASLERVYDITAIEDELEHDHETPKITHPKGDISFKNVSFGYGPDHLLMTDVTFDVKAKQTVAIVGPTGAGKTTLVNLLMRFYDINSGEISFDGIDTQTMTRTDVRNMFGMVLQDTWLFEGTVADNIAYGRKDASREAIIEAAKLAQSHDFIMQMPQGYDTIISSDAAIVSQGQQQLLTIARAALANPSVMILDEATSNIDTITEQKIQKALNALMENRTSFVIAHRLSTIRNADMILVMNKGNIIESGNHDTLLALGGIYADLYHSQFAIA